MPLEQIRIETTDGTCPASILTPEGAREGAREGGGPWPAIIVYMDAFAIRPALVGMARRLADAGYVVLLPDLFYRFGSYATLEPKEVFKGDFRAVIGPMMATTDNHKAAQDSAAFLAYLDSRDDVAGTKIGTVGFCMGGGMALTVAGTYPDRVAAAASFHGGNLATDAPTSPHLLAPRITAEVYVAGAENDHSYPPEMAERLERALNEAGVRHRSEIYAGAAHGWMKTDFPVYDHDAAERGWSEMLALFGRTLPA
ncbi:dienelactone hydrolase family protein [Sphingomonas sp. RB3P16]|uniref:dienelactone hydrolase family protein n=1 Tax=Parasphingomonas frigoris TaxID=3096163 RepID=UPI002FCB82D3